MTHCLRITRRTNWADRRGEWITRKEWRAYIEKDPELRFDGADSAHWSGFTTLECPLLVWRHGNIEASGPDLEFIRKVVTVASALEAVVQGNDGETYNSDGSSLPRPEIASGFRATVWLRGLDSMRTLRIDPVVLLVAGWVLAGFLAVGFLIALLGARWLNN